MDPIANMLVAIKNAGERRLASACVPFSKVNFAIAKILADEGYLEKVTEVTKEEKGFIEIHLKYLGNNFAIKSLKRISKPGRRYYVKRTDLPTVKSNLGLAIISTSAGIMTAKEARRKGLGGEIMLEVW